MECLKLGALIPIIVSGCSNGHTEAAGHADSAQPSGGDGGTEAAAEADSAQTYTDGGSCAAPTAANTYDDASVTGCYQRDRLFNCVALPESPDGTAVGCSDTCLPSEYTLVCYGASVAETAPNSSLNCHAILLPMLGNEVSWCCPCSESD